MKDGELHHISWMINSMLYGMYERVWKIVYPPGVSGRYDAYS
jgi:hypothetical protein